MLQIVEILLFFQMISTGSSMPTADQINSLTVNNQQAIQGVLTNTDLMQQVDNQYHDAAQGIIHIDFDEGTK